MFFKKGAKLFCLIASLSMCLIPFIGASQSVYATSISNETDEIVLDDIDKAVGEVSISLRKLKHSLLMKFLQNGEV